MYTHIYCTYICHFMHFPFIPKNSVFIWYHFLQPEEQPSWNRYLLVTNFLHLQLSEMFLFHLHVEG